MHDSARRVLIEQLRRVTDPDIRDRLLDRLYDFQHRATNWDAPQWGFPHRWMEDERRELVARGGRNWPTEPAMRTANPTRTDTPRQPYRS